jgi:hypothetical protein
MDDMFFPVVVMVLVGVLATFGVMYLAMDFRHYNEVVKQCNEQGYIQNKTTRIKCAVEK